eukprot:9400480-Pyramimonas_sp.AAC.1
MASGAFSDSLPTETTVKPLCSRLVTAEFAKLSREFFASTPEPYNARAASVVRARETSPRSAPAAL